MKWLQQMPLKATRIDVCEFFSKAGKLVEIIFLKSCVLIEGMVFYVTSSLLLAHVLLCCLFPFSFTRVHVGSFDVLVGSD